MRATQFDGLNLVTNRHAVFTLSVQPADAHACIPCSLLTSPLEQLFLLHSPFQCSFVSIRSAVSFYFLQR